METILSPLADSAGSSGVGAAGGAGASALQSGGSTQSVVSQGDTVIFSAEGLAKAAAMASNAAAVSATAAASNAGGGQSAQGQTFGAAKEADEEESQEANILLEALKSRVERLKEEIKEAGESALPQKEREAKLTTLRSELVEAQTAYLKAKLAAQGGKARGGSRAEGFAKSLT
jgi:hypothetical protein